MRLLQCNSLLCTLLPGANALRTFQSASSACVRRLHGARASGEVGLCGKDERQRQVRNSGARMAGAGCLGLVAVAVLRWPFVCAAVPGDDRGGPGHVRQGPRVHEHPTRHPNTRTNTRKDNPLLHLLRRSPTTRPIASAAATRVLEHRTIAPTAPHLRSSSRICVLMRCSWAWGKRGGGGCEGMKTHEGEGGRTRACMFVGTGEGTSLRGQPAGLGDKLHLPRRPQCCAPPNVEREMAGSRGVQWGYAGQRGQGPRLCPPQARCRYTLEPRGLPHRPQPAPRPESRTTLGPRPTAHSPEAPARHQQDGSPAPPPCRPTCSRALNLGFFSFCGTTWAVGRGERDELPGRARLC